MIKTTTYRAPSSHPTYTPAPLYLYTLTLVLYDLISSIGGLIMRVCEGSLNVYSGSKPCYGWGVYR